MWLRGVRLHSTTWVHLSFNGIIGFVCYFGGDQKRNNNWLDMAIILAFTNIYLPPNGKSGDQKSEVYPLLLKISNKYH